MSQTTRYRGVYWDARKGRWRAALRRSGRLVHLGYYDQDTDAARAYDAEAVAAFGPDAIRNFPAEPVQAIGVRRPRRTQGRCEKRSRYPFVYWEVRRAGWQVVYSQGGKSVWGGFFRDEDEAGQRALELIRDRGLQCRLAAVRVYPATVST